MVAEHTNLCASVPGAARQSWHEWSSMPKRGTAAFRVCDHCPPEIADARSTRSDGFHKSRTGPATLAHAWPRRSLATPLMQPNSVSVPAARVPPASGALGMSPGSSTPANRHRQRRTPSCTMEATAAGESKRTSIT